MLSLDSTRSCPFCSRAATLPKEAGCPLSAGLTSFHSGGRLVPQVVLDLGLLQPVDDALLRRLTRVRVLRIEGCLGVTTVEMLSHLRELNAEGCSNLVPTAHMMSIARLRAKGCGKGRGDRR